MKLEAEIRAGPKYDQVRQHLKQKIEQGEFEYGEYLPPEAQLAQTFGMSIGTIKKALNKLRADHYIERRRGQGTRVCYVSAPVRDARMVAVLLGDIKQSFFAAIYDGVQTELVAANRRPVLLNTALSLEKEREGIRAYGKLAGGLIVVPLVGTRNHPDYAQLLVDGVPLVFVDRYLPELNVDAVMSDNVQGGYLATRHLLELGHERIAVLGTKGAVSIRQRVEGHRKALAESGLPLDDDLLFDLEENSFESGYEVTRALIADHSDVTAALCLRDDVAWGCLQRLSEMAICVPEKFSVIGYDDNEDICSRLRPQLTTVRQPKSEMGRTAARILLQRMSGEVESGPQVVHLPVQLVVRQSTGRAPR